MRHQHLLSTCASAAALCLLHSTAQAQSLDSCGDIHVEAQAQCEVVPPGVECEGMCTPVSVEAACAAQLTAKCEGQCSASASAQCSGSCSADCKAKCMVDPGKFDCALECQAHCGGTCEGQCSASSNKAECKASCEATCGASCDGKCDVEAPSADCDAKCEASCSGSCEAQANIDCQVDCQADFYADCKVDVKGGCEVDCETMEGALFCGGQYVDHGNNLEECVAALEAALDADVEGYASGSGECANGTCKADGEAGVSCSAAPYQAASTGGLGVLALGGLALIARRRRS